MMKQNISGSFLHKLMKTLFEHHKQITIADRVDLESYLSSLWITYKELWPDKSYNRENPHSTSYQPFLSFDGNLAKANNYIGFITHEATAIEIYPKVFKNVYPVNKELMHRHLFYWFNYCRKVKFPFNESFLTTFEIDEFPELIIYLISNQMHTAVSSLPYSAYEEISEALFTPRGRINFARYTNRVAYGQPHIIDCDHEPFIFDNILNRIIKYCARLMLTKTRLPETQRLLHEVIFLLDEVDDQVCSTSQLDALRLTAVFHVYDQVLRSCRMILENRIYSHEQYEMQNWSLLFPMEYVYEDFIAGFIQEHFGDEFVVEPQKSELFLPQDPKAFNLQHDILLTHKTTGGQIIVDAKYKPRWGLSATDPKKGVSQADMYQMISYAYRRGTDKVLILYPNTTKNLAEDVTFTIEKARGNESIKIKIAEVPFWSETNHLNIEDAFKARLRKILSSKF
jgi:5-methylcytosine-specific restriction enzyme subunit McrC